MKNYGSFLHTDGDLPALSILSLAVSIQFTIVNHTPLIESVLN